MAEGCQLMPELGTRAADLRVPLIACGVTGNGPPLFGCRPEHLALSCVWLKRLTCKAPLTKHRLR